MLFFTEFNTLRQNFGVFRVQKERFAGRGEVNSPCQSSQSSASLAKSANVHGFIDKDICLECARGSGCQPLFGHAGKIQSIHDAIVVEVCGRRPLRFQPRRAEIAAGSDGEGAYIEMRFELVGVLRDVRGAVSNQRRAVNAFLSLDSPFAGTTKGGSNDKGGMGQCRADTWVCPCDVCIGPVIRARRWPGLRGRGG